MAINSYSLLVALFWLVLAKAFNSCGVLDEQFLVTFHPHLDAFWLNTDNELKDINFRPASFLYTMNQRNSKTIFNSMLKALLENPRRKYFVTQVVFFKDWYDYLDTQDKIKVKILLQNQQLQITNGGWVQNDQAVCYYDDILDQYTLGINFLQTQFGYINRIGWSTDNFGHSHSQAAIQHLLGFQFQGIERVDDRYIYERVDGPLLEFYWQAFSDSNNKSYAGVATLVRHFLHQVNDLRIIREGVLSRDFIKLETKMKQLYSKQKLFRFLGNDFEEFISSEFQLLEQSMEKLNQEKNNKCPTYKYGNPKDYLALTKLQWEQSQIPIRKYDFMPNYDQGHYWSGFFTTNPQFKILSKDFSRLFNLYKKILLQMDSFSQRAITTQAWQLLSVIQHHDGITGTSKGYVQDLFLQHIKSTSIKVVEEIKKIYNLQGSQVCSLYQNNYFCQLTSRTSSVMFSILHQGVFKQHKIEIKLPKGSDYLVQGIESNILCEDDAKNCILVFQSMLTPGINHFLILAVTKEEAQKKTVTVKDSLNFLYEANGIVVALENKKTIRYQYGDQTIKLGYWKSANYHSEMEISSWDKYGHKKLKRESSVAGQYIMANDGKVTQLQANFQTMRYAKVLGKYLKIFIQDKTGDINVELELNIKQPGSISLQTHFYPQSRKLSDYFLSAESSEVQSQKDFYHDSNGYLVAKRTINQRPDYTIQEKPADIINANTYAACSFAYLIQNQRKFVAFVDRAEGVTLLNKALFFNIDRLAMDDQKGTGQSYQKKVHNVFRHNFWVVDRHFNIQRIWQRHYDEAALGFFQQQPSHSSNPHKQDEMVQTFLFAKYLKYAVTFLNQTEMIVRFHNLADFEQLRLPMFNRQSWQIKSIGISLKYTSIKETFASGISFQNRYQWKGISNDINVGTREDSQNQIVLQPLQIRTFRITMSQLKTHQTQKKGIQNQIKKLSQPITDNIKTQPTEKIPTSLPPLQTSQNKESKVLPTQRPASQLAKEPEEQPVESQTPLSTEKQVIIPPEGHRSEAKPESAVARLGNLKLKKENIKAIPVEYTHRRCQ